MASKHGYWTNASVKALVEGSDADPVEVITQKAITISLTAMQQGWTGPPFDSFRLANFLGIRVVPREDIADARTVPAGSSFTIEFNPNRPKARIRYSICHELAHTLFPDCRERVRHRLTHATMKGDDWQLEMLCNLAAAELAMPIGSMPHISDEHLDIDRVLELREKYAVSVEAMLLRIVKLTDQQCSFFCAARTSAPDAPNPKYVVDYVKPSKVWQDASLPPGMLLPKDSVASECTAIGFTARGQEDWGVVGKVRVECVGVSPYPSQTFPRVIGLFRPHRQTSRHVPSITYLKGDASQTRGSGSRFLIQIVNDAAFTWGAGFSLVLRKKWPGLQQAFRAWAMGRQNLRLGNIHLGQVDETLSVVSMVAQHGYGPSPRPRIRYVSLRDCLKKVGEIAFQRGATVHMPRIGCGLAGGSWDVVSELVTDTICSKGVKVFVYDLPGAQPKGHPQAVIQFSNQA